MSNNGGSSYARPLAGLGLVVALLAVFGLSIALFGGKFTETVPVTVISERAGLVMNPDAKVKMRGVQVGTVKSIDYRPDGTAALQLDMDPSQLHLIPSNVNVDIASSTVFGAKFVQLEAPPNPTAETLQQGQVLKGDSHRLLHRDPGDHALTVRSVRRHVRGKRSERPLAPLHDKSLVGLDRGGLA